MIGCEPLIVSGGQEETLVFWREELARKDFCPRLLSEIESVAVNVELGLVSVQLRNGSHYVLRVDSFQIEYESSYMHVEDLGRESGNKETIGQELKPKMLPNFQVNNGMAKLVEFYDGTLNHSIFPLIRKNKMFNPQRNKSFDLTEIYHKSGEIVLLFEKLSHKLSKQTIYARLKFFKINESSRTCTLLQTILENHFDAQLQFIYSVTDPNGEKGLPIFVTVHSKYSKVWKCEQDPKKKKWKWSNCFTKFNQNLIAQNCGFENEKLTFYSICTEKKSGEHCFEKYSECSGLVLEEELNNSNGEVRMMLTCGSHLILVFDTVLEIRNKSTFNLILNKSFDKILYANVIGFNRLILIAVDRSRISLFQLEKNVLVKSEKLTKILQKHLSNKIRDLDNFHYIFDEKQR